MSAQIAHAFAFSLATTLMATVVIFRAGDGTLSVTPAVEYDGDEAAIVREIDPRLLERQTGGCDGGRSSRHRDCCQLCPSCRCD